MSGHKKAGLIADADDADACSGVSSRATDVSGPCDIGVGIMQMFITNDTQFR